MKEHPLLCTDSVVRNILDGRQTQDRRPFVMPRAWGDRITHDDLESGGFWVCSGTHWQYGDDRVACPFGVPGDVLWVRECWRLGVTIADQVCVVYRADGAARFALYDNDGEGIFVGLGAGCMASTPPDVRWRPSIHMPREACRTRLDVLRVWVERVQDISEADAIAEGMERRFEADGSKYGAELITAAESFLQLWDCLYGTRDQNPWVWCCEFKVKK